MQRSEMSSRRNDVIVGFPDDDDDRRKTPRRIEIGGNIFEIPKYLWNMITELPDTIASLLRDKDDDNDR